MDWNTLSWKCKRQKRIFDSLCIVCAALIILIIVLYSYSTEVRYQTMADMAAAAAEHTYWRDRYDYDSYRLENEIARLTEQYEALLQEKQAMLEAAQN